MVGRLSGTLFSFGVAVAVAVSPFGIRDLAALLALAEDSVVCDLPWKPQFSTAVSSRS